MNNKQKIMAAIAAVILLSVLFFITKQPFNMGDIGAALKAAVLMAGGLYLKKCADEERGSGADSGLPFIVYDAIYRLSFFICAMVLMNRGFELYRAAAVLKALLFFVSGLAFVAAAFYAFTDRNRQFTYSYASYSPVSNKMLAVKSGIAMALGLLGVFFVKTCHVMFAVTTYVFLTAQLLFIFKSAPAGQIPLEPGAPGRELKTTAKLISLAMIGFALYFFYKSFIYLQNYDIRIAMLSMFTGALLFGWARSGPGYETTPEDGKLSRAFDLIFAVFIFAAGLAIFGYKLMDIPPGIHGDETLSVNMAISLGRGDVMPVVLDSEGYNGMTLLYYWILSVLGKVWGTTIITSRWFSVFTGAAGLVFVYLLIKEIFSRRLAIISSLLLSTFFMMVFYSRNAILWIQVPAFAAAAYYFFFRGIKSGKPGFFVAAGVILSMDLCFYSAAKAAPFVLFLWIALMFLRKETRGIITSNWKGIALMLFTMFLIFLPVINYIIHHANYYFLRMNNMNYLKNIPTVSEKITALTENIIRNLQMFMTLSANGYAHNLPQKPFFDAFTAFAAVAGTGYLVYTWKKESSSFVILWALFGLLPGFLSRLGVEDPYPARTVLAIPAVILIVSLGVERVIAKVESLWPKYFKPAAVLCAVYFITWFSFYNLRNYFVVFANDPHTQTYYRYVDKMNADYMAKNTDRKIMISPFFTQNYYFGLIKELSSPIYQRYISIEDVSLLQLSSIYDEKGRAVTLIGEGIYSKLFPIYREYFPNANIKIFWDPNFWFLDPTSNIKYCYEWKYPDKTIAMSHVYAWFSVYDNDVKIVRLARAEISAQDIENTFTLKGLFYKNGSKAAEEKVFFPVKAQAGGFDGGVISGLLEVPEYGRYEFRVDGAGGTLYIDNSQVNGGVELYKGLHRIRLTLGRVNGGEISLLWKSNITGNFSVIERKYLINSDKIFGVLATYRDKGKITYKELEPSIDYRGYVGNRRPAYKYSTDNTYTIDWNGTIRIPTTDTYTFKLHTLYDAVITLDGAVVYRQEKGVEHITPVRLAGGVKQFRIVSPYLYIANLWDPGSTIRFMYKDGAHREYMPVTYDMLRP